MTFSLVVAALTGLGIGFLAGFVSVKFTDTREMVWVGIAVGVQVRERTRACVRVWLKGGDGRVVFGGMPRHRCL